MAQPTTTDDSPAPSSDGARRKHLARVLARFVSCAALLCSGCTIYIGPYDGSEETAPGRPSVLPDPIEGPADEPALDEAQRARKEEAERYTAEVIYQGGEILATFQLPSGDVLDFINRDTLPALPYEIPPLPFPPEDLVLPPGVEFGLTEVEQSSELLELAATATPFHRPTFWPYILGETDATSIEDYLARYQMGGEPAGISRLYAALASNEPNRGVSGYMNQFRPEVALNSFSLIEFAVGCPAGAPPQEVIGVAISVDKVNSIGRNQKGVWDGEPRLHIEYIRLVNGQDSNKWDGSDGTFVANPLRHHHPGQKVPVSVLDETVLEHHIAIFQAPGTGDWWIAYNGDLLGYYPAKLFTMLNGGACTSAWYGEVLRRYPTQGNVKTEMGSGRFAEDGLLAAAHVRNPMYYDLLWAPTEPKGDLFYNPNQPLCYSRMPLMHLAAPWDSSFFFLGGPGGRNPECNWP